MSPSDFRFGFRILGSPYEDRRLVDHTAALAGYAACDPRAECGREAYLSAFCFPEDFRRLLLETGSTAGYSGPCWSPWLWFDIDAEGDLPRAQAESEALAEVLVTRYQVAAADLLVFFSGSKGFHVGLPTALWSPAPSADFHRTARRFAEHVAELAGATIDAGVYDRVRAFRAPNSKHPKTGLHKRRLTLAELAGSLDVILELAKTPAPLKLPTAAKTSETAAADWAAAVALVKTEGQAKAARRVAGNGSPTLNRLTLDFIREGAGTGGRHRLLFSAAANLAEFGCSPALAVALLEESALDSGLPPKDVRRGIECGLAAAGTAPTQQDAGQSLQTDPNGSTVKEPPEAAESDPGGSDGQQSTRATDPTPAAGDLQAALTKLWGSTPATPPADAAGGSPADATPAPARIPDQAKGPPVLPPDPPPLRALPAGPSARASSTSLASAVVRSMSSCRFPGAGPAAIAASAVASPAGAAGRTREGRRHDQC
jgi:hypothetical protein